MILDGHVFSDLKWKNCHVQIAIEDGQIEITPKRDGYDDEPISIELEDLNYAIEILNNAPGRQEEEGEVEEIEDGGVG